MEMAPHLALWPEVCLTVVVYSLNMFGDAVRDLLDFDAEAGGVAGEREVLARALRRGPGQNLTATAVWRRHVTTYHGASCEIDSKPGSRSL